jgi:Reverse transcriptase (RNA-dependent DNA polymerase)
MFYTYASLLLFQKLRMYVLCSFNDLRAISILPCVSKIIERIAHDQLTSYLNRNSLMNEHQSGFRRGFSTTSALLKVTVVAMVDKNC